MEPFAQTINAAKKYVVSSTLERLDWNAELVRGDLGEAVQQLKREPARAWRISEPWVTTLDQLVDAIENVRSRDPRGWTTCVIPADHPRRRV